MPARPVRLYRSHDGQVIVGYDIGSRDNVGTEDESATLENVRRYDDVTGETMAYYDVLEGVYVRDEITRRDDTYAYWADRWMRDEYDACHAEWVRVDDMRREAGRAFDEIRNVVGEL
jgi:hypothetical protein